RSCSRTSCRTRSQPALLLQFGLFVVVLHPRAYVVQREHVVIGITPRVLESFVGFAGLRIADAIGAVAQLFEDATVLRDQPPKLLLAEFLGVFHPSSAFAACSACHATHFAAAAVRADRRRCWGVVLCILIADIARPMALASGLTVFFRFFTSISF